MSKKQEQNNKKQNNKKQEIEVNVEWPV